MTRRCVCAAAWVVAMVMVVSAGARSGAALEAGLGVWVRGGWEPPTTGAEEPRTIAEVSGYEQTSTHDEVTGFVDALAGASERVVKVEIGKTVEGRAITMMVIADPPVKNAEEARRSGKLVALVFGNIHSGECDGKEAALMLARELGTTEGHELLKGLVVLIVPNLNADGNERMAEGNRRGQLGPARMGVRENAQGLDLNRDFVKLESPEVRALVRACNEWDAAVVMDLHTTNGSRHGYTLTYQGPKHPAGDARVIEYVRDEMLPTVGKAMEEKTGYKSFFYGNFAGWTDEQGYARWEGYPCEPRYGTEYRGLGNRVAILSESYSYASYKDRVLAGLAFTRGCLAYAAEHRDAIRKLIREADERTARLGREAGSEREEGSEPDLVAIRTKMVAFEEKVKVLGFVERGGEGGRREVTGEAREYEVELVNRFEGELSVERPWGYVMPGSRRDVVELLLRHGVEVEELREDIELDVETYTIDSVVKSEREFQGHRMARAEATGHAEARMMPAGTVLVRTGQRLGSLIVNLLEPEAEDGLAAWNFFDAELAAGAEFPVLRVVKGAVVTTCAVKKLDEDRTFDQPITFDVLYEATRRPNFNGSPVGGQRWLDDGEHYLQQKDGALRKIEARTGRASPWLDTEAMEAALAGLPTVGRRAAERLARPGGLRMDETRTGALFEHENDLYYATLDGKVAVRLTSTPEEEELSSFSPDGRFVGFVRGNDLFVVDVATQTERRLTTTGTELVTNGKAGWVYFEEVFNRSWRTYWWSPDSERIAFLETDSARVPEFVLVHDGPEPQREERTRYPKPGQANPSVRLGVVTTAGGSVGWVDCSEYDTDQFLITGVGFTPDSQKVWLYVQDRVQTWLDLCMASVSGGKPERLMRETTGAWVNVPDDVRFLKDGSFVLPSERSGYRHLYQFEKDGKLRRALTEGEWDVMSVDAVDKEEGWMYVTATKDSPIAHHVYRLDLGTLEMVRVTREAGHHRGVVSPKGNYVIDSWSDARTPPRSVLRDGMGEVVRVLDTNPVYEVEEYRWGATEFVKIPAGDGAYELEATVTTPPGFDATKRHPVWFQTYAGPYAPTVRDAWNGGRTWDQMMAQKGFVVFRCDPYSASGKGAQSAWKAYKRLGAPELEDIRTAIGWLKEKPYVDGSRIGMSGHSYGGFMTAYAMTHSDLFAAGIAGAPVTDWRDYDTIYTERYMLTPQMNPEGYKETSVVEGAKDLKGRLLLLHGTMDDNVHMQNSVRLVQALHREGKMFEFMAYPGARHGIGGKHYNRLVVDFIERTLGSGPGSEGEVAGADGAERERATMGTGEREQVGGEGRRRGGRRGSGAAERE